MIRVGVFVECAEGRETVEGIRKGATLPDRRRGQKGMDWGGVDAHNRQPKEVDKSDVL